MTPTITLPLLVRGVDPATDLALPPDAGIRLVGTAEVATFIAAVGESLAGLVVADRIDPEVDALLRRILLAVPEAHLVLGLRSSRVSSREYPGIGAGRVEIVGSLPDPGALQRGAWRTWF
ncbi:MAG: hypothetical protein RQ745_12430, partial [Longimicrobiales bacterium]|nr:hypothetical protein [Longimicrobiales bacterium]